jgi:shikimate dehydrogenase
MSDNRFVPKKVPTFYFVGVTTGKSSIMKVFPLWMQVLRRPEVIIEGIDHPIHDTPDSYRATVAFIKSDPLSLGGLVTTHKMDIYAAAQDMFDYLDPYAQLTHELSSISKLDGRLEGHAKDPITAGRSLDAIIEPGYFGRTGGEVLCFGAGGSAVATLLHLINKPEKGDRPSRFVVVNRSQPRLDHMRGMVEQVKTDIAVEYILNADPQRNDALLARLPEASIVINATGMGKDTPGSPITDAGQFPRRGIAWEFNYRGELDFLHQALRQREARELRVEDGWVYFLHGWSQVVAQVLHVELTDALFAELDKAASTVRG